MSQSANHFRTTASAPARSKAQAQAIAANDAAAAIAPYFALTFLMSAMFVFMLMLGWAAGV
jgi:hypothetical protein